MLLAPPLCWSCGGPARRREPLCRDCRLALRWLGPAAVDAAGVPLFAPVAYEGPARDLVRALKYRGAAAVADTMAAAIRATMPDGFLDGAVLVPVPLAPRRRRARGFNQAELIARALASRAGVRVDDALARDDADPQVGRGRPERLAAQRGLVAVRRGARAPARAVLVDDVVTTGGTLAASAEALRAAGSRGVGAVVFARTSGR